MEKQKQAWSAGLLFLIVIVCNIGMEFLPFDKFPLVMRVLIPQLGLLLPVIIYCLVTKQNLFRLIRFRKVNGWSLLLLIPLVYCMQPAIMVINALSMTVVENHVSDVMTQFTMEIPYVFGILMMAMLPGFVEETLFRGVMLNSFHRDSNPWPAIVVSAVCFGFMHMNINQLLYATFLGVVLGILLEASGSIISTMLTHTIFNASSVSLLYLMQGMQDMVVKHPEVFRRYMSQDDMRQLQEAFSQTSQAPDKSVMLGVAMMMIIPAIIGLALVGLLLYAIAALNKRQLIFRGMFTKKTQLQREAIKKDRVKIITPWLIGGLVLCLGFSIFLEILFRIRQ